MLKTPLISYFNSENWDYKNTNKKLTQKAIPKFDRKQSFEKLDVNKKVKVFTETLKNILSNQIPQKTVKKLITISLRTEL